MNKHISRFIVGGAVIALGVVFLLNNADILAVNHLLSRWWPLLIVLAAALMLISDVKNYLWVALIAVLGGLLQLKVLGYITVDPWQVVWPLALIGIGLTIVLKHADGQLDSSEGNDEDVSAVLSGINQRNTSDDFTQSRVTAVLGGVKLDLRKAKIKKSATIKVLAVCGGLELIVPRNVVINNKTSAILGGTEDKTDQDGNKNSPVLTITGDVILGGIEIKN